jgi:hypothetical protein
MNHTTTGPRDSRPADGTGEAREAERAAMQLADAIADGTLYPGLAAAHGYRGIIYALLAARETLAERTLDIGNAIADLEAAVRAPAAAGAAVPGEDDGHGLLAPAPTHVLSWIPGWEYRTPEPWWSLQAAPGADVTVPGAAVPAELGNRDADPAELTEWLSGVLGYDVVLNPGWRLTGRIRALRAGRFPEYTAYPADTRRCDGTTAGVIALEEGGRILLAPAVIGRPACGTGLLAPPAAHAEGLEWAGTARTALASWGVAAADLRQESSGWRHDRCRRLPARVGKGHMWLLYRAEMAWGEPEGGARWVTSSELQALADRTIAALSGHPAGDEDEEGLDPAWIGWLHDARLIKATDAGRAAAAAAAARPQVPGRLA